MRLRAGAAVLAVLAAAAIAASCGLGRGSGAAEGRGESLIVGRASDPLSLDPARTTDSESIETCEQVFEHLVRYRFDSMEIEPALATHWEVAPNGREWTFHLRTGVTFHDGTPLTADAVVWSLERQRDPSHRDHKPDFVYWESSFRNIQKIEKVDELTVRITIERPYAPFLANLAMFPVSILSPGAVRRAGEGYDRHPVGTGPFRFVEWIPGERLVLTANPYYWGGAPKLEYLVFRPIRDARQRLQAMEGNAVDVAYGLAPHDIPYVRLHPDLMLHRAPGNNVAYLAMNTQKPPFNDVRVRRAVNYAINKVPLTKLIHQGMATPAKGPVPPGLWGYLADQPDYHYDRERARALLREAGVPVGVRPRLYTSADPRPYLPAPERVARIIAYNLREVGLNVEVVSQPLGAHLRSMSNGEHDLCLHGWTGDNGDPDNFLYMLLDRDNTVPGLARNVAFYRNGALHGLLIWARESGDRAERVRLYEQAQRIVHEEAPWVPLWHSDFTAVAHRAVRDFTIHPAAVIYYAKVRHAR
ncbi:MAG TPA: ABC transporter substrate-binding protein [Polyangia bacterium]